MRILRFELFKNSKFMIGDNNNNNNNLKETFSSDSLFSAIINNLSLIEPNKIDEIILRFKNGTNSISSLFLGLKINDEKTNSETDIYFIPRPHLNIIGPDLLSSKRFKKIKYLSIKALKKYSKNIINNNITLKVIEKDHVILEDEFLLLKDEIQLISEDAFSMKELRNLDFIKTKEKPKVTVDRLFGNNDNNFYYSNELNIFANKSRYISIEPFYYALLRGELEEYLLASLNLLVDQGIGGKRSIGFGGFVSLELLDQTDIFAENSESKYFYNLSVICPERADMKSLLTYSLDKRSGYVYSEGGTSFKKNGIFVIKEGSIFKNEVKGQIIDIAPSDFNDHPIYLNGKAFLLGLGGE